MIIVYDEFILQIHVSGSTSHSVSDGKMMEELEQFLIQFENHGIDGSLRWKSLGTTQQHQIILSFPN